jgi:hypothetical protein
LSRTEEDKGVKAPLFTRKVRGENMVKNVFYYFVGLLVLIFLAFLGLGLTTM